MTSLAITPDLFIKSRDVLLHIYKRTRIQGQINKSHSVGHSHRVRMGDQEGPVW